MLRPHSVPHAPASLFAKGIWPALMFAWALAVLPAAAQQDRAVADRPLRQASLERTDAAGRSTVQFGHPAPRVGDRFEQAISLEMRMTTSVRQGNELIEKNRANLRTDQRRAVTTTEVAGGLATAVVVRYLEATKRMHVRDSTAGDDDQAAADETPREAQIVQGKAYHCRRKPGDDGNLIVTDEQGNVPPMQEYEVVAQSMEIVGRPNPLAEFLAGRSVAVGETIALPQEIADRLFQLGDRFGEVVQFELTLERIVTGEGAPRAEFLASVEAASVGSSQMRLQVEGPLVVETDSCRALHIDLSGPIGLVETRGSYSTSHQLLGTGRLQMRIDSVFHDAEQ